MMVDLFFTWETGSKIFVFSILIDGKISEIDINKIPHSGRKLHAVRDFSVYL